MKEDITIKICMIILNLIIIISIVGCIGTSLNRSKYYTHKGECPMCHEQLIKYCYGYGNPQFIWSCPNGCED